MVCVSRRRAVTLPGTGDYPRISPRAAKLVHTAFMMVPGFTQSPTVNILPAPRAECSSQLILQHETTGEDHAVCRIARLDTGAYGDDASLLHADRHGAGQHGDSSVLDGCQDVDAGVAGNC